MRRRAAVPAVDRVARLGVTQVQFAEAFPLSVRTLRDWELRRRTPDGPARALVLAIRAAQAREWNCPSARWHLYVCVDRDR